MYAFYVFDLPEQTTDEAVEARYRALVRRYPPDRAPAQFSLIRQAYEALRTERDRLKTQLFYQDKIGDDLTVGLQLLNQGPPPRLTEAALSALLREEDLDA